MGLSPDTPLADSFTIGRSLHVADGPDEVHLQALARLEIKDSLSARSAGADYLTAMQPGGAA
jgi:acyl-CoA dehydrogenase